VTIVVVAGSNNCETLVIIKNANSSASVLRIVLIHDFSYY
jgi:hypothetical protein